MQCPSCQAEVPAGSSFCPHCGATFAGGPAAGAPGTPYTPVGGAYTPTPGAPYAAPGAPAATSGGLSDTAAGALAYVTIIPAIIFLVMEPYNRKPFIRFHAFQCLALAVVAVVTHIILAFIPVIGWIISLPVSLLFLILVIVCILKASKGEWFKLPVIGDFALKQATGTGATV